MSAESWRRLAEALPQDEREPWLARVLERNANTAYLRSFGSPRTVQAFRERVPAVGYDDVRPWIDRIVLGETDVLFAGRPIAYERTGGNAGGAKLIPYSTKGVEDFGRALLPWLVEGSRKHRIAGRAYFAVSPATRPPESIRGVPVGLPDGAYLGEATAVHLAEVSAVPFDVASLQDVDQWRAQTLSYLLAACDLELISVWSPTFLLRLLDDVPNPISTWPRLRLVSCWASAASRPFAQALAARLPHASLQPKGLLSTECAVTIPDSHDRPVLNSHGFFEFERDGALYLADELAQDAIYEVVATTASGLYRYRTGDLVRYEGLASSGRPILEFIGRGALVCDLVGEKLTEPFVAACLADVSGFRLLVPAAEGDGYVLAAEAGSMPNVDEIEQRLCDNPQYAYARKLRQLKALRLIEVERLFDRYAEAQVRRGVRLGDVKPVALRSERTWIATLGVTP